MELGVSQTYLTTDEHHRLRGKWGNLCTKWALLMAGRSKISTQLQPRFCFTVTHLSRSLATCLISNCNCIRYLSGCILGWKALPGIVQSLVWPAIRTPLGNGMPQCPALYLKPLSSAIFNRSNIFRLPNTT